MSWYNVNDPDEDKVQKMLENPVDSADLTSAMSAVLSNTRPKDDTQHDSVLGTPNISDDVKQARLNEILGSFSRVGQPDFTGKPEQFTPDMLLNAEGMKWKNSPHTTAGVNPGNVPVDTSLGDDEDEEDESSPAVSMAPRAPVQKGDPEMQAALTKMRERQGLLAMLEGSNRIGAALTYRKPDENYTKSLEAMATGPVQDLQLLRQSEAQKMQLDNERAMNDPNSDASRIERENVKALMQASGFESLADNITDGMSGAQVKALLGGVNTQQLLQHHEAVEARLEAARMRQMQMQMMLENKLNDKQNSAVKNTISTLESMRGNPAAAQAEKDIYAADKAKALFDKFKGNPNPEMTRLLVTELGKLAASGSAPTMHELDMLTPSTLMTKFASVYQKLTNHPTPANATAFLKQYMDYANDVTAQAKQLIQQRYGRVIETNRKAMGETGYNTVKDQYYNRFINPSASDDINGIINSRTDEQNAARLKQLEQQYGAK